MPYLEGQSWYKNLKELYPSWTFENAFIGRDHKKGESITITGYVEHPTETEIDENTGEETIVQKDRIHNEDFKNNANVPLDFRVSISKETPVSDIDRTMDKKKMKERLSFVRKNLSIDLTTCMGDTHDMDSEDPVVYQIEM